MFSDGWY